VINLFICFRDHAFLIDRLHKKCSLFLHTCLYNSCYCRNVQSRKKYKEKKNRKTKESISILRRTNFFKCECELLGSKSRISLSLSLSLSYFIDKYIYLFYILYFYNVMYPMLLIFLVFFFHYLFFFSFYFYFFTF